MFTFHADIIKRRKVSIVSLFIGIIGASIIGYLIPPFLENGRVNIVEDFIRQVGLQDYTTIVYLSLFGLLLLAVIPAIKNVFQKKMIKSGYVHFDEENLKIVKGKEKFLIPGEELQELSFELKNKSNKKALAPGGSFMKIPTQKGTFICEIDYKEENHHKDLSNIIKVLKIKHEVKVAVRELN
ncbi:MAG: hypothetical protein AB8F74_16735 [Saprospiraceae bacterium]